MKIVQSVEIFFDVHTVFLKKDGVTRKKIVFSDNGITFSTDLFNSIIPDKEVDLRKITFIPYSQIKRVDTIAEHGKYETLT